MDMEYHAGTDSINRVAVACGTIETVAVCLRLLARRQSKAHFAADDWVIVVTLVPSYAMLIIGAYMVTAGKAGQHVDTLTRSDIVVFLKTLNCTLITYSLTITMAKISILLLYRRIFATPSFRKATVVVGSLCVAWGLIAILCLIFQCHPISGLWNPDLTFTSKCFELQAYYRSVSGTNMGLDIIILCMPLHMIGGLKLPTMQKIILCGIFMLGGLTCVASLMRIITINFIKDVDLTYSVITPYLWSQIEASMAIICACLVTYRPLLKFLDFKFFGNTSWAKKSLSKVSKKSEGGTTDSEGSMKWPSRRYSASDRELLTFDKLDNKGASRNPHAVELSDVAPAMAQTNNAHDEIVPVGTMRKEDLWV